MIAADMPLSQPLCQQVSAITDNSDTLARHCKYKDDCNPLLTNNPNWSCHAGPAHSLQIFLLLHVHFAVNDNCDTLHIRCFWSSSSELTSLVPWIKQMIIHVKRQRDSSSAGCSSLSAKQDLAFSIDEDFSFKAARACLEEQMLRIALQGGVIHPRIPSIRPCLGHLISTHLKCCHEVLSSRSNWYQSTAYKLQTGFHWQLTLNSTVTCCSSHCTSL